MADQFNANLERAYRLLEDRFNSYRTPENLEFCRRKSDYWDDELLTPIPVAQSFDGNPNQRITINLSNGYVIKTKPRGQIGGRTFHYVVCNPNDLRTEDRNQPDFQEEKNATILRQTGFTKERGFYVPDHRVIGLTIENGKIRVNPNGIDFTLAEDVSEDGTYKLDDVKPYHFVTLDNAGDFLDDYKRHIDALLGLYHNPKIRATIKRHGRPSNPVEPISRMLLARTKDNVGEIVIGDLDNILFEET